MHLNPSRGGPTQRDVFADSLLFGQDDNLSRLANTGMTSTPANTLHISPVKTAHPSKKGYLHNSNFDNSLYEENLRKNGDRSYIERSQLSRRPPTKSLMMDNNTTIRHNPHPNPLPMGERDYSHSQPPKTPLIHSSPTSQMRPRRWMQDKSNVEVERENERIRGRGYEDSVDSSRLSVNALDVSFNPFNQPNVEQAQRTNGRGDGLDLAGFRPFTANIGNLSPALDRMETIWSTWVLIHGFDTFSYRIHDLIAQFSVFGEIEAHHESKSNWVLFKFRTPENAERATHRPCLFLNLNDKKSLEVVSSSSNSSQGQLLLSVNRMSPDLAKYLGVSINRDGMLVVDEAGGADYNSADDSSIGLVGGTGLRERSRLGEDGIARTRHYSLNSSGKGNIDHIYHPDDLYLMPKRQKNICERIMEYFWSY